MMYPIPWTRLPQDHKYPKWTNDSSTSQSFLPRGESFSYPRVISIFPLMVYYSIAVICVCRYIPFMGKRQGQREEDKRPIPDELSRSIWPPNAGVSRPRIINEFTLESPAWPPAESLAQADRATQPQVHFS
jgi:hypothetical protein